MPPISPMSIYCFQRLRHEVAPLPPFPGTKPSRRAKEQFTGSLYC